MLARPVGGYLSDRIGAQRVLLICFGGTALLAGGLVALVVETVRLRSPAVAGGLERLLPGFRPAGRRPG